MEMEPLNIIQMRLTFTRFQRQNSKWKSSSVKTHHPKQQECIKFYQGLDNSGMETLQMLQMVCAEQMTTQPQWYEWHQRFKHGHEALEDDLYN